MKNFSNRAVALVTLASWALILVISLINGFLFGSPPIDSVLPPILSALIGWFAFVVTIFSIIKLYLSDQRDSNESNLML